MPPLCLFLTLGWNCQPAPSHDLLIQGARVYTGTDTAPQSLDVAIRADQVSGVFPPGQGPVARRVIDASGLVLAPGFIDPHTHALPDLMDSSRAANLSFLYQGVTTVFVGNDGSSPPIAETLSHWDVQGIGPNAALFVGHGSIRRAVVGSEDVAPTEAQLATMQQAVEQAMEAGAFGLSTGLFYAPGSYATTEEVIALARVAAAHGGLYDTHLRDESSYTVGLLAAVEEALRIGEEATIPVHLSHIKCLGADVWGKSEEVIELVEAAQARGIQVSANQYPYTASKTSLIAALLPRWAEDGGHDALRTRLQQPALRSRLDPAIAENIRRRGGPETLVLTNCKDSSLNFQSLEAIAQNRSLSPTEATVQLILEGETPGVISHNMQEHDLQMFMQQPWVVTGSDGGSAHPRKYGSFPRVIHHYSQEKNVLSLGEALYRSSTRTAEVLGLLDRGRIEPGYAADLVIFDPATIQDLATFEQPERYARGVVYLLVNGQLVIEGGQFTGQLAGKALRKTDYHGKEIP